MFDLTDEPDGSLTPRDRDGAVIHDPAAVLARAIRMARDGLVTTVNGRDISMPVETICTHGDTPGSHGLTRLLREALEGEGMTVRPVGA